MQTRRLFIGIPLSPPLAKRLARDMDVLSRDVFLHTAETNLHVTLLFLGFVKDDDLPEISERFTDALRNVPPFEMHFTGISLVPSSDDPKMIWLTGESDPALSALRSALEETFGTAASGNLGFRPHVTLARIKRARYQALDPKPDVAKAFRAVEPVEAVTLFESTTIDGKRRYVPIDSIPLGGSSEQL